MLFVQGNLVYAFRELFDRRVYCALELQSGKLVSEFGSDAAEIDRLKAKGGPTTEEDLIFPEVLAERSPDHAVVYRTVLSRCREEDLRGPIEFLRCGKYVLMSFHQSTRRARRFIEPSTDNLDGLVDNRFVIVEENSGKIVYEETLNSKSPNPVPDSFFVKNNVVYFIREKQQLVATLLRT